MMSFQRTELSEVEESCDKFVKEEGPDGLSHATDRALVSVALVDSVDLLSFEVKLVSTGSHSIQTTHVHSFQCSVS